MSLRVLLSCHQQYVEDISSRCQIHYTFYTASRCVNLRLWALLASRDEKDIHSVYTWMSKRVGKISGFKDIFQGYHTKGDVQSTYVGAVFHNNENITYRSTRTMSSRCLSDRTLLSKNSPLLAAPPLIQQLDNDA